MDEYKKLIHQLVDENMKILADRGYFSNTKENPSTEEDARRQLQKHVEDAVEESLKSPGPKSFEMVNLCRNRNAGTTIFTLGFDYNHKEKTLEVTSLKIDINGVEESFQLPTPYDLPPTHLSEALFNAVQEIQRVVRKSPRNMFDDDESLGKSLN